MQIMEGDVIKFGHMNGAAVRPGQTAPQANAEFAFMVERANPSYDYIGFVDGRRVRPVTCSGDTEYCTEIEGRTIDHGEVARPTVMQSVKPPHSQNVTQHLNAPCTTASVSSTAGTNPMAGLVWPGALGYNQSIPGFPYSGFPVNPAYLQHPQWAQQLQMLSQQAVHSQQQSGFRVPDVFGATACMGPSSGPPSTSASLFPLTQRGFALQNNALVNSLLTPAAPSPSSQQQSQQIPHQQQLPQQLQQQQHSMATDEKNTVNATISGKETRLSSGCMEPVSATTSATTHVPDPAPITKIPVASPPMECDSSVPSPPKTSVASTSNTSSAQPPSRANVSPLRKEGRQKDVRSERSFADSPQPPRAPAPAPWDSTPSPRPRDYSPDRESTATRDTEKDRDYEKEKDQKDVEKDKEEKAKNKGSWVNTVRRVSSTSRRPTDEIIIERNSKKEKKKIEKMRKKERSREQRASFASSSSVSSMATPAPSKPGRRRLKQLSDDSSSSESSSDSEQSPPTSRKAVEKKRAESKKKVAGKSASDVSSSRSSDSDYDSDDRVTSKKGHKRRYSSSEKLVDKRKSNTSNSSAVVSKKKGKGPGRKRQEAISDEEESVTQHDPQTTCALNGECTKPQSEQVGWIFCDDCQNWFHNICILGREEAPDDEFFYCGCKAKKKAKKR
ncbi:unnamed protein product [Strongylus vulgaris]|uniref:PHD-type domain-containing protein n=1 Tax=Strongylus vulgaris TaxID=40348 RepID=A0A3P7HVR5_STRVU|nr:unnamed protein product [Strongylus vulgaris]